MRIALLAGLVIALEFIVFRSYFRGVDIPPWDFLGSYNTDAFLWWSEGGFFTPVDWIPNVWGGYPSALNLQNSAWYLPVGLANLVTPFTLHAAAIVAALHVAMGFVGTYLLVRSFRHSFSVSTVIAVASFFGVAYFSNAQHVDIARAYALIPWIFLVMSPAWSWKRLWGIPVAMFILWQAVTGMYPGMVVSTVYVGVVWIATHQIRTRSSLRTYLFPLAIAAVGAVMLSAPRLVPYFLTQEGGPEPWPEGSEFSAAMVGTLLFGYSSGDLPNDVSMRSFFIPATALILAFFARFHDSTTKQALAMGIPAVLLGLPFFPWFAAAQSLPGLGLSRFTMSDFKAFIILAVLLLAAAGLTALSRLSSDNGVPRRMWWSVGATGAFVVLMGVVGVMGPFTRVEWFPPMVILGLAWLATVVFILLRRRVNPAWPVLTGVLIVLTAASGMTWVFTTPVTWKAPRVEAETAAYGAPVSEMLEQRVDASDLVQRPARQKVEPGYDLSDLRDVHWNRTYYDGEYAVGGYLNLKGSLTPAQLESALLDEDNGEAFMEFLAAPGQAVTVENYSSSALEEAIETCTTLGDCGKVKETPAGYSPGHLEYRIGATRNVSTVFNEPFYRGWSAAACDERCVEVPVSRTELGLIRVDLPAGDYRIVLDYQAPGRFLGWVLFGVGIAIAAASAVGISWSLRNSRKQRT